MDYDQEQRSMNKKRSTIFAWIFFGLIAVSVATALIFDLSTRPAGEKPTLAELVFPLIPVTFAFVGALIISRQPRNVIGLLMMLPGISLFVVVDVYMKQFSTAPESPSGLFLLVLWFSNWNWLLLIMPILFLMLLFPTGRPPSPRWRWLVYFGLGMSALLILLATFSQQLEPAGVEVEWTVRNPIGFITAEWVETYFMGPWFFSLPILTLLCSVSLFVRFRRAQAVERQQIKWLFYACAVFAATYVPSFVGDTFSEAENLWNILWALGMLTIPAAIAIAILRYRLYDIDIIIRRTLEYTLLTALLALVYFGSVVLLQSVVENLTGEQSPIVIVISTLTIAALFNPLRIRVQNFIDRRFFRKKYNAEQTLAHFAATAHDEVDMDELTAALLGVIDETMQPERTSLWLNQ